ncbi:glycosyltransferase [Novosphingobium sp.]|uniref:glycosyltransferase n=1 Tax=Novosphingobium sp. TaxID=1874826 RepID=UPI003B51F867
MVALVKIGIVVIGRNEGDRLAKCFASLPVGVPTIYIDSGSSDDSLALAERNGIPAILLCSPPNHTAARARNAGLAWLRLNCPEVTYVMLVDGDCQLSAGWLALAQHTLDNNAGLGLVFGRRREQFPHLSIYNRLCDLEWDCPIGEALTAGGDIFCRIDAITAIGGYRASMIAGEDPDMACRLRTDGWKIRRLDADMTVHDAAIRHFSQWWKRTQRGGHAFAELAHFHPSIDAPDWQRQCNSIIAWGGIFPLLVLISLLFGTIFGYSWFVANALLASIWLLQMARLTIKRRDLPMRLSIANSWFLLVGKIPQLSGMIQYGMARLSGRNSHLIEYKIDPR